MSSGFEIANADGAMCCICFEWSPKSKLFRDADGQLWNICNTDRCVVDAFGANRLRDTCEETSRG